MKTTKALKILREEIISCRLCPRLVAYRESVVPKKPYENQIYWHKPVPGFGDPEAKVLILGLAPAAHGGNRTGRVFTGDLSGVFLYRALYRQGWANQPTSFSINDGLILKGCYVTASVKCAPPLNKPTPQECANCSRYLDQEFQLLPHLKGVLALGSLAFHAYLKFARKEGKEVSGLRFSHGGVYHIPGLPVLYASYHPSPRNVNTGRLTHPMFMKILHTIQKDHF